ncbi:peroxiredoxin [Limisalsivibrio acetivorans]|uniref:peroxiredoxin n=1 Tax=Limisalsivibrio acetivorans TaxID=1304888 RepID=UPI0003B65FB5|nr:peroxiredoxin [Limisalsivibrio acetivorans]
MAELKEGDQIPGFELEGDDGKVYTPEDFKGDRLIIYFYPKDNTPGCTVEAKDFTALTEDFGRLGYKVVGVSPDKTATHCRFKEKHELGVLLLSDPEKEAAEAFGAYGEKKNYGKTYMGIIRSTFAFDEGGKLIKSYKNVRATGHAQRVLDDLS